MTHDAHFARGSITRYSGEARCHYDLTGMLDETPVFLV